MKAENQFTSYFQIRIGLCNAVGNESKDVGESADESDHVGEAGKEEVEDGFEVLVLLVGVLRHQGGHQAQEEAHQEATQWSSEEGENDNDIREHLQKVFIPIILMSGQR